MEYNKSLNARIKRRNNYGFSGLGSGKMIINGEVRSFNSVRISQMGNYADPKQNYKDVDYELAKRRKNRCRINYIKFTKRYADNHQRI